ncbi:MAG: glutamate--tRNA ligase [Porticoccaceae bacterium]|jgi:glutamyl-tRNA synthetase|nr:MAG: glutamate--tRNA ligase [SAR92 bacterium BACL16 MAG-120619-bin48]MDP4654112.1 glutamate--tRNA ligase [Alphaproteobacteria bacterium]MDP4752578.1 glutamate--tRNA ligase [Porticoccaceae bacterium]MDP4889734.1 glutamate--tRNA ligase [Porticoccaceae bacterium]MDP4987603.1 glutamate--tRNA ligase [Porticoccaceae bacterium]
MTVRTRIAPSPTGDPHVGTAYVALFNMAFARSQGGQFLLRIEDTDRTRSTPESEKAILDALHWLGLDWDEGPDNGGPHGPYRQSERSDIYRHHADLLLQTGKAFRCFCSTDRLDSLRKTQMEDKQQVGYDGHCLHLSSEDVAARLANHEPHVVRMEVPREGQCTFDDMLRGEISIDWAQIDMQVLLKEDGMPTYHLANVVDDHLMEITHVIRGEEWINSAPKHILLYQYFGWERPVFCHLPLLRNTDKSKLSKRKNPTSILFYQRMGYLPEALLNYLGRMGWSMPDEREKFTLADMLEVFDIQRVSLGGPVFDVEKLSWLNGMWIREELSDEQLADRLQEWALNRERLMAFLPFAKQRMETLSDIAPLGNYLVSGMLPISADDLKATGMDEEQLVIALQFALWRLESVQVWQRDNIFNALKAIADGLDIKLKPFLAPFFIAIAGSSASISVMDSMHLLGADMSRARLRHAIELLGGVGKKKLKKLESDYQQLA